MRRQDGGFGFFDGPLTNGRLGLKGTRPLGRGTFWSGMILHSPVGIEELALVFDSGMRAFPPRLPEQPIFYPVTNFGYETALL